MILLDKLCLGPVPWKRLPNESDRIECAHVQIPGPKLNCELNFKLYQFNGIRRIHHHKLGETLEFQRLKRSLFRHTENLICCHQWNDVRRLGCQSSLNVGPL